ncbi:hypothetical protein JTB14_037692 [Gonioctena quinquepunctata]|nr:hypothetical protein JTB14_037691 [Gonioctena quinquepunctata]KAG5888854.1 hypothetical protein JTB14_037692 [Gonioctena quinquepunctata]
MAKCYVWSMLLYRVEACTLKISTMIRIEALRKWIHRRMSKIPWTAHNTNEEVLRRVNRYRVLLKTVKYWKMSYLGRVLRGNRYRLLQLILNGKI